MSVITYQSPDGQVINLTQSQIETLEQAGVWPRTSRGEEYCSVSHGLHVGTPSYSDAALLAAVGIS